MNQEFFTKKRALITGVGLVVVIGTIRMVTAHHQLTQRYQAALAAQRQLEQQVSDLWADRERLSTSLQEEQQRGQQLAETLSAKDQELQRTVERLAQEGQTVHQLEEKLTAMQRQFNLLQGELAVTLDDQHAGAPSDQQAVQLERVIVTQTGASEPAIQGRVVSVHPEWQFVVINLGWDVVKVGDEVSLYRNDQLLGKARVERVQEQVSAVTLLPDWNKAEIQVDDAVRLL